MPKRIIKIFPAQLFSTYYPAIVVAGIILGLGTVLACVAKPINWLPEASKSGTLLGVLLTAQATITALTLAVSLFVLQAVGTRQDVDDRIYRQYVSQSWVRLIFWGSVGAVATTAAVLITEKSVGQASIALEAAPGLRNLFLIAATAFFANLMLVILLFERSIWMSRPGQWRNLRQLVNQRDVRRAVQAFLGRPRRGGS